MMTTSMLAKPLTGLLGVLLAVGLVAGGAVGAAAADEPDSSGAATSSATGEVGSTDAAAPDPAATDAPGAEAPDSAATPDAATPAPTSNSAPTATPAPDPTPAPTDAPAATERDPLHFDLVQGSVASFRAGDIISDAKMWNGAAMTAAQVQSFLTSTVPLCDNTDCLDIKVFPATPAQAKNDDCAAVPGGYTRAAQIIAAAGKACGVSQKALLALIQKESSLVGLAAPTAADYAHATGYDCPDTPSGCSDEFAGFSPQVYGAARQLRDYQLDPPSQYPVGDTVDIAYSPDSTCGTGPVTIRTLATAALYRYTPYQPNAAALKDGSDGNACSSLGNLNFWFVYTDWFGYPHLDVDRIQAPDRYSESVAIAEEAYPDGATTVYLATGTGYADALSAGPAAVKDHAPLLLTTTDSLPDTIAAEFSKLDPDEVVIVGGPNSVSPGVQTQLANLLPGVQIARVSGADRFEVSRNMAQRAFGSGASGAYVATGLNFPDALSASGAGGHNGEPVILVNGGAASVDPATAALLTTLKVKNVTIAGGPNSVSAGMQSSIDALPGVATQRQAGADRFAASLAINKDAYDNSDPNHPNPSDRVFLATGLNFPDALAGSALAGAQGSPLIVVPGTCVPQDVKLSFKFFDNTKVTLLGGPNSLDAGVENLTSC
jgi:putative cell wall-binding protein